MSEEEWGGGGGGGVKTRETRRKMKVAKFKTQDPRSLQFFPALSVTQTVRHRGVGYLVDYVPIRNQPLHRINRVLGIPWSKRSIP